MSIADGGDIARTAQADVLGLGRTRTCSGRPTPRSSTMDVTFECMREQITE